jgi:hypothetical protein
VGDKDDPAVVARDGFEAMMAGKERVVTASLPMVGIYLVCPDLAERLRG